jgi:hypothetical protein
MKEAVAEGDRGPTAADVQAALARFEQADAGAIHRAELALAELVVDHGPPGSAQHLELARRFVGGERVLAELTEAKQDCWTYVGSLACGCSVTDSASAHVMLACLETGPGTHGPGALGEQVERVLRCGVPAERVAGVLRSLLALLVGVLTLCSLSDAARAAPKRDPPLLFGGPVARPKQAPLIDPRLPTGAALSARAPRPRGESSLCSFARPVCVHAAPGAASVPLENALRSLENAYERVVLALGLPAPLGDSDAGGSDALDWYLEGGPDSELLVEQEPLAVGRFDSAPVFCRGGAGQGVLLERAATLCVGEALASRLDAGEQPDARRALALELWWIVGAKTALDVQAIDAAQRVPELALAAEGAGRTGAASRFALLLEMLETTRSLAGPGILTASLYSAAASRTPPAAAVHDNEPDVFDVLRHSMEEDTTRYADLMIDFTLRRALAGDRDDGTRLPSLQYAGSFARPRFDWVIPFSSLPRRVLSGKPIAQTGAQLIWLEMDDAPIGAAIGFRAEWEAPVAFQWRILLIDKQGNEVRRVNVTFQDNATSADARVLRIDGAKAIIIAGFNVGGVDLAHPFDPDVAPFEPSACTVYLASM